MRILAVSYLFPNRFAPNYGIFVFNRLKALQKYCDIRVINPIPWFPFCSHLSRYRHIEQIPYRENFQGLEVVHPRFFIIPRYFKIIDPITCALAVIPTALKLQKSFPFDIVDVHWTYPDLPGGRMLARMSGKPQIVTLRGKEAFYEDQPVCRKIVASCLPGADFTISLSEELAEMGRSCGIPAIKSRVIRNGVDTKHFFYMSKEECRKRLGLPENEKIILSVGSLIFQKGFDRIIHAIPALLKDWPDLVFYIVGSEGPAGDFRKGLHNMIAQAGLENRVRFVGQIPNDELVYWYNAVDMFCLASRGEGSPNVLTEALACGCPSLSTDTGAVREIISGDFMGQVVPNSDTAVLPGLEQVLSRTYDRERIAAHMQRFDWDWCARQVMDVYQQVLETSGR